MELLRSEEPEKGDSSRAPGGRANADRQGLRVCGPRPRTTIISTLPKSLGLEGFLANGGTGPADAPRTEDDIVDWFTVSYRSDLHRDRSWWCSSGGGAGYYFWTGNAAAAGADRRRRRATVTTARFTTIEGNVKVKTVGTFEWVNADRSMVLRKSDLVRTGPGAAAEITFFDGTVVHVRPDSLITIEETLGGPADQAAPGGLAHLLGRGAVQRRRGRNAPGAEREISTPTVRTTTREDGRGRHPRAGVGRERRQALHGHGHGGRPRPARRGPAGRQHAS